MINYHSESTCNKCGKKILLKKNKKNVWLKFDDIKSNKFHTCKIQKYKQKSNYSSSKYFRHNINMDVSPRQESRKTKESENISPNGKKYRICSYCNTEFLWHKTEEGRWIPIEEDGIIHSCEEYKKQHPTKCNQCERPIQFIKNSGDKWQPFDLDGKAHNCANFFRKQI